MVKLLLQILMLLQTRRPRPQRLSSGHGILWQHRQQLVNLPYRICRQLGGGLRLLPERTPADGHHLPTRQVVGKDLQQKMFCKLDI